MVMNVSVVVGGQVVNVISGLLSVQGNVSGVVWMVQVNIWGLVGNQFVVLYGCNSGVGLGLGVYIDLSSMYVQNGLDIGWRL